MLLKFFPGFAVLFLLAGCATTQQPSTVNALQIKVAQLENKLEEKDQQINALQDQVRDLSGQVESNETNPAMESTKSSASSDFSKSSSKKDIIRVGVNAEKIQTALKKAGYYDGPIDGKMGSRSQKAIAEFQKDHNLTSDGIIGQRTWIELKKYLD